jgi:DNA repair protein SbcC/Rad50
MRIARVRVRNIRSYRDATLDLGPGTTLLVGDVGSGKTSLLYAIEMALFGTAEIDAAYLLRHASVEGEVCVRLVDDGHEYEIERAFRRVRRKGRDVFESTRLAYREDGAATKYSATELRQRVIDLLGFRDNPSPRAHSDLWRWAVYVPQERMREILGAEVTDRLRTIRRALGVERYKVAAENAKDVARDLRQVASGLRDQAALLSRFSEEHARVIEEIARLGTERAGIDQQEGLLARDREEARIRSLAAQEAVARLDAERREIDALHRDTESDAQLLAGAERARLERAREIDRLRREQETLAGRVAERGARREAWEGVQRELERRRGELDRRSAEQAAAAAARSRLTDLERSATDAARDLRALRSELERLSKVGAEMDRELERLGAPVTDARPLEAIDHELGVARTLEAERGESLALAKRNREELVQLLALGVCPRCGQAVRPAEFGTHRTEAETAVARAEETLGEARTERERLEELRTVVEEQEHRAERRSVVVEQRREVARQLEAATGSVRTLEQRTAEIVHLTEIVGLEVTAAGARESQLAEARTEVEEAELRARDARDRWSESERAISELAAGAERLDRLGEAEQEYERSRTLLAERRRERDARIAVLEASLAHEAETRAGAAAAADRLGRAEEDLRAAAERRARLEARLEAAEAERLRAEQGRSDRDALLARSADVEARATWISGPFCAALGTMEARVLESAHADFRRHFQRYFAALVDDPEMSATVDAEFTPSAGIRGQSTPAEALSGGERTSLALAFRLALARVVRSVGDLKLDTLLLDEPTDGFSPEQVQSMGELLEELALPQVVLVSHERELEGVADRVVRVVKEGGRSILQGPGASAEDGGDAAVPSPASS